MARTLYKNGVIFILDEPTSALDPLAEEEIYSKFREMTEDRTSLFVTHRLASTRFCDRIFVFQDMAVFWSRALMRSCWQSRVNTANYIPYRHLITSVRKGRKDNGR